VTPIVGETKVSLLWIVPLLIAITVAWCLILLKDFFVQISATALPACLAGGVCYGTLALLLAGLHDKNGIKVKLGNGKSIQLAGNGFDGAFLGVVVYASAEEYSTV